MAALPASLIAIAALRSGGSLCSIASAAVRISMNKKVITFVMTVAVPG